jgi:hypothetical protein
VWVETPPVGGGLGQPQPALAAQDAGQLLDQVFLGRPLRRVFGDVDFVGTTDRSSVELQPFRPLLQHIIYLSPIASPIDWLVGVD